MTDVSERDFMVWPPIPDAPDPATPAGPPPRRRRSLTFRLLGLLLIVLLVLIGAGVGGFFLYERHLDRNVERIGNPFAGLPEARRPAPAPAGATDILLLGSDSRISSAPSGWVRGAQRTDAIMIAHVPADRSAVTVTSIPRDRWVTVPGHGRNRLNAAFGLGGPALMVQTVEDLTGVRMDHVLIVDFEGFRDITDELGGVRITVAGGGRQTMDGRTALAYVRQPKDRPGGDVERVERQQQWIRAVILKTLDRGTLTDPRKLSSVLGSFTSSIAADDDFTIGRMRSLAGSLRGIRGDDLTFRTEPEAGPAR